MTTPVQLHLQTGNHFASTVVNCAPGGDGRRGSFVAHHRIPPTVTIITSSFQPPCEQQQIAGKIMDFAISCVLRECHVASEREMICIVGCRCMSAEPGAHPGIHHCSRHRYSGCAVGQQQLRRVRGCVRARSGYHVIHVHNPGCHHQRYWCAALPITQITSSNGLNGR